MPRQTSNQSARLSPRPSKRSQDNSQHAASSSSNLPTPETIERIAYNVERGTPIRVALQAEGVAKSTYYYWRHKAEADPAIAELLDPIARAYAQFVAGNCGVIHDAARGRTEGDWKAAAWILGRGVPEFREKFEQVESIQHEDIDLNTVSQSLNISVDALADAIYNAHKSKGE